MRKQKFDIQRRKSVCLSQYHCAFQKRCFMRDTCKNNAKQWCYILKLMYGCRPGSSKFQNLKNSSTQKTIFPLFTSSNIFPDSDFEQKKTCSAFKR